MSNDRIPTIPQSEERIPTVPQDNGRIPTVPQTEGRIPTVPQANGRIATVPQANERVATVPQDGRVATVPQDKTTSSTTSGIMLHSDVSFNGIMGGVYTIKSQQVISSDSGESQIYGCVASHSNERLVARILKSVTPTSSAEKLASRQKVIDFLIRNSRNEKAHILPLVDHGTVSVGSTSYFVEVYPYCESGDLGTQKGTIPYDVICNKIIPGINEALHTFHSAGLVHRDVKPDNLYWYKDSIVLGDFGITCDLRSDGFATDRSKTGTLGYYAPELMSQAALISSDYYSFGQTLWTLYSGEMMYQNILRRYHSEGIDEQRNQINFSMMNGVYYGFEEIRPEEKFFEILIRGLLQYDPSSRFDYAQVNRWLAGDKSLAHEITKFDDKSIYKKPFRYNGGECWDNFQLYDVLRQNWDDAKALLYSGTLKEFFLSHDFGMANEIDRLMREYASSQNDTEYDIGLARLLLSLNSGKYLSWRGVEYRTFKGFSAHIVDHYMQEDGFKTTPQITDLIASGLIGYWYQLLYGKNRDEYAVRLIQEAQALAKSRSDYYQLVAYSIFEMYFPHQPIFAKFNDCENLADVVLALCATKEKRYSHVLYGLARSARFYGFLFSQGYYDYAHTTLQAQNSDRDIVENLYSFLEQQIEDAELREKLVEYYRTDGPMAYLLWFKNNMDLYQFNGEEAQAIKNEIERYTVTGNTLSEVRASYAGLKTLSTQFRQMFVADVYQARLGITHGKETNGITSNHLNAYWHKLLFNESVPIGYDVQ